MNDKTRTEMMKLSIKLLDNDYSKNQIIEEAILKLCPKEPIEQIEFVIISAIEMYGSLLTSINEAGGDTIGWSADELLKMTVMNLISHLATNHVRFTFEKPKND